MPLATLGTVLVALMGCVDYAGNSEHRISLYTPDSDSGTFDFFMEALKLEGQRKDVQASSDDNTLVTGVAGDVDSLGYFGYAYFTDHADKLRAVPIQADNDSEPVLPSPETIYSGKYSPLSRPMYIYVKNELMKRPEGSRFVQFYLRNIDRLAREGGYVPPTEEQKAKNFAALETLIKRAGRPTQRDQPVIVDGSSTVFPISAAAQEAYDDATPGTPKIIVDVHGTGGGFGRYLQGEVDIVDASRPATAAEEQAALEKGYYWTRFVVGYDGLTVVVHPKNDFVDKLTVAQLRQLFEPGSSVMTWNDLNPDWPGTAVGTISE